MKVMLIGGGGREHALAWKLAQSSRVDKLWVAPGNGGIAGELTVGGEPVECVPIGADDLPELLKFSLQHQPDLTVVGPDNPLAEGIVDLLRSTACAFGGRTRRPHNLSPQKYSRRILWHGTAFRRPRRAHSIFQRRPKRLRQSSMVVVW